MGNGASVCLGRDGWRVVGGRRAAVDGGVQHLAGAGAEPAALQAVDGVCDRRAALHQPIVPHRPFGVVFTGVAGEHLYRRIPCFSFGPSRRLSIAQALPHAGPQPAPCGAYRRRALLRHGSPPLAG